MKIQHSVYAVALFAVIGATVSASGAEPQKAPVQTAQAQAAPPKNEERLDPIKAKPPMQTPTAGAQTSTITRLSVASAVSPDETVPDGDFISSARYYGDWRLSCEARLSKNSRVCRLEQDMARNGRWALSWRLVQATDQKQYFVVVFPKEADPQQGLQVVVGGFARQIKSQEWTCLATTCETYFEADATARQLILGAQTIAFRYSLGTEAVEIPASMKGLTAALSAASSDPLGANARQEQSANAAAAPAPTPRKKASLSE
ncbi:invasion associated locus B family protein [Microvirga puerhi]|uniref:Invasion associated locus B family protein n=1 Tax=Microvirga puerhi TaxID=2876078 RepID=A0ABS7VTR6_9HYPH|nr:invasion associated locus B family protein [Microvirga puerhi]MBZ6078950.1 invasion associated locus B family protein [Microvirga puerhi]